MTYQNGHRASGAKGTRQALRRILHTAAAACHVNSTIHGTLTSCLDCDGDTNSVWLDETSKNARQCTRHCHTELRYICGGARRTPVNQRSRVQWRRTEAWQRNVILQCEEQGYYTCTHTPTHTHTHACILPHTPWRAKHPGEHGSDTMLRQTTRTTGMMKYCSKHTHK